MNKIITSIFKFLSPDEGSHDTRRKLASFRELKQGWHYGEGVPFSQCVIKSATTINQEALQLGFTETDAFPGIGGEIRVTVYHNIHYLEFTVETDGQITFVYEKDQEEIYYEEKLSLQESKRRLKEFYDQWNGYEFSAGSGGMNLASDDTIALLLDQEAMKKSQWSTTSVLYLPEKPSVGISRNTTRPWRTTRPFSGASRQKSFQRVMS